MFSKTHPHIYSPKDWNNLQNTPEWKQFIYIKLDVCYASSLIFVEGFCWKNMFITSTSSKTQPPCPPNTFWGWMWKGITQFLQLLTLGSTQKYHVDVTILFDPRFCCKILAQIFQFLTPLWQKSFGIPQDSGHQQRAVRLGLLFFGTP